MTIGVHWPELAFEHDPDNVRRGRVAEHTFELTFLDAGVQACVFTFG